MAKGKDAYALLDKTFKQWQGDRAPQLSAALTYYTFLSVAPLLVLLVGVAGRYLGQSNVTEGIFEQAYKLAGTAGEQLARELVASTMPSTLGTVASIVAFGIAFGGAMQVFRQLRFAFDVMWNIPPDDAPEGGMWEQFKWSMSGLGKQNLAAFAMVLLVGALFVVSLVLSSVVAVASEWIAPALDIAPPSLRALEGALSVVLVTALFALIYRYLPRTSIAWKDVWVGAIMTAALFMVGRVLLGAYFTVASPGSAYGAAGSVLALLIWTNYSLQLVLFGAEFTHVWTYAYGSRAVRSA